MPFKLERPYEGPKPCVMTVDGGPPCGNLTRNQFNYGPRGMIPVCDDCLEAMEQICLRIHAEQN
jgi:hypothetical protein